MPRAKKTTETAPAKDEQNTPQQEESQDSNQPVNPAYDDSDDLHQGWTAQSDAPLPVPNSFDDHQIFVPRRMSANGPQMADSKGLSLLNGEKDGARTDGSSGAAFASSPDNIPSDASLKGTGVVDAYVANGDPGPTQVPGGNVSDATIHEDGPQDDSSNKENSNKTTQSKNSADADKK